MTRKRRSSWRCAVIVRDEEVASTIRGSSNLQKYARASADILRRHSNIFVSVPLLELQSMSDFIRRANGKHALRGLFVRDRDRSNLVPQMLCESNLRTLKNMIVHADVGVPARVVNAHRSGAETDLIADARMVEDHLVVITCAGEVLKICVNQISFLERLSRDERRHFAIASDGSDLYWHQGDLHIDLEILRMILDPTLAAEARRRRVKSDDLFGQAVASLRGAEGLRQSDIEGVSERNLRRIEKGETASSNVIEHLAVAHNLSIEEYLEAIARRIGKLRGKTSRR